MKVNGTSITLDKSQTLQEFLKSQGYEISTVAVELDGEIVPKSEYNRRIVCEESALEIVRFVGGG